VNIPYQFLDTLAPEATRTADHSVADERVGRLFAAASRSRGRLARRARALAGRSYPAQRPAPPFRKADPQMLRGQAAPPRSCPGTGFEIVAKPGPNGHRNPR